MQLEDVSNEALANIAAGYQRKRLEHNLPPEDFQVILDAVTYCYLQLLRMQNAEFAFEAPLDRETDEPLNQG